MSEIRIKNVGPIESVSIPVPEGGGVVVLRGRNGCGKSTALDAIDTMARGSSTLEARARRGTKKGTVEGLGATVNVGLRRATRTGQIEVDTFDARVNVAALVDPGVKDPEAADRRRIATACALAGIEPDRERFRAICGTADDSLLTGELVEVAARVRAEIQRRARAEEQRSIELAERARTIRAEVGDVEGAPSVDEAQAAMEAAMRHDAEIRARAKAAEESSGRLAAARKKLDEIGKDVPDVADLYRKVHACADAVRGASNALDDLREQVRAAERRLEDAESAHVSAIERAHAGRRAAEEHAAAVAVVEEASTVTGPTDQEVAQAADSLRACREALAKASAAERAAERVKVADQSAAEAEAAASEAEQLRADAASVDGVLADHLSALMPQGLGILDGRLMADRDGRQVPFAELSEGERWRIALDIAIEAMGGAGLVAIDQPAWEGLDGDSRRAIAEHARKRGVVIVTAEADHGSVGALRAEVYGETEGEA